MLLTSQLIPAPYFMCSTGKLEPSPSQVDFLVEKYLMREETLEINHRVETPKKKQRAKLNLLLLLILPYRARSWKIPEKQTYSTITFKLLHSHSITNGVLDTLDLNKNREEREEQYISSSAADILVTWRLCSFSFYTKYRTSICLCDNDNLLY